MYSSPLLCAPTNPLAATSEARPPTWAPASCTATSGSYRSPLYDALVSSGIDNASFRFVGSQVAGPSTLPLLQRNHEGHPGWTVAQLTGIANTWVAFQPDIVLLHAGTNDANGVHSTAQYVADMTLLLNVTATRLPLARVFVATIINSYFKPANPGIIAAYNAALPAVVAAFPNASLVDMAAQTGLCSPAGVDCVSTDRTHPTMAGYPRMAAVWFGAIAPLFS